MNISRTAHYAPAKTIKPSPLQRSSEAQPQAVSAEPRDTFTFSGNNDGWKIAGITVGLFSVPMAIATKSVPMALFGAGVGLALAFGPDN